MKKFFKKQREILTIFAYIGIIASLVCFVIFPLIGKINDVADRIQEESLNQEIAKQRLNEIPKMQQQYQMLEKDERLLDVLLDKNNAVPLIERLEKLAQDSQNKIAISVQEQSALVQKNTLKTNKKNAENEKLIIDSLPSAEYLQMKIVLTGNYDSIVKFLEHLENLDYYSDIIGLDMKKVEIENEAQEVEPEVSFGSRRAYPAKKENNAQIIEATRASVDVVFYTKK